VSARSYVLLGASGLVGGHLRALLANDPTYTEGRVLGRRATGSGGPREREIVVDFGRPETYAEHLAVDDVFCCLGTTIKKAGSQAAFREVDCDIPVAVGREARARGAKQYLIVTAVGADAKSGVFYNRVKVEAALTALDFPGGLKVFHPSLIIGDRTERRPAERVAMAFMTATRPLFAGGLVRYRAIEAEAIARAMHRAARGPSPRGAGVTVGVTVYEGKSLFDEGRVS
jgi:uncharacterized protein YbjT (DUF2867 family)